MDFRSIFPSAIHVPIHATSSSSFFRPPIALTVALAIPRWVSGQQNCDLDPFPSGNARYLSTTELVHDENTGLEPKPVQMGRKNIRLVVVPNREENLLTLPIARVMRDQSGHFVYDSDFCSTLPACQRQ